MPARSALEFFRQRTRSFNRLGILRPMTTSELMDATLRIYRNEGRRMLALTLVPALFAFAGLTFYLHLVFPRFFTTMNPDSPNAQVLEVLIAFGLSLVSALPLLLLGLGWLNGLVIRVTADFVHGKNPETRDVLRSARSVLKNLFLQLVLLTGNMLVLPLLGFVLMVASARLSHMGHDVGVGLTFMAGLLALMVAFFMVPVVVVRSGVAPVACVVERLGPRASMARSKELMQGRKGLPSALDRLMNLALLGGLTFIVILVGLAGGFAMIGISAWLSQTLPLNLPAQWISNGLTIFPWFAALWLSAPLWGIGTTLLYYDRRSRLEAYDIEMHAREAFPGLRDSAPMVR